MHPSPPAPPVQISLAYGGNNGVNKQSRLLFRPNFCRNSCCNSYRFSMLFAKVEKRHLNLDKSSDGIPGSISKAGYFFDRISVGIPVGILKDF